MVTNKIESAVLEWYNRNYSFKPLFSKNKPELTLETSLSTGKYPWAREAGDEIMNEYFELFNVDNNEFDFLAYWPYEKGLWPNFLRPKSYKIPDVEPKPLTIHMLVESAKAGRWLYKA